jgi:acyl-CoA thioesterase
MRGTSSVLAITAYFVSIFKHTIATIVTSSGSTRCANCRNLLQPVNNEVIMADFDASSFPDSLRIPWAQFLGATVAGHSATSLSLKLVPKPEHLNHTGSVNAPIQWGVGEAAAVSIVLGHILPYLKTTHITVKGATLEYVRPAWGTVISKAEINLEAVNQITEAAQKGEPLDIPVKVTNYDKEDRVVMNAQATVAIRPART